MGVTGKISFNSYLSLDEILKEYKRISLGHNFNVSFIKDENKHDGYIILLNDVENVELVEKLGKFPVYHTRKVKSYNDFCVQNGCYEKVYFMLQTELKHLQQIGKIKNTFNSLF